MSENPYAYPDYESPYVKTEYTGTIRMQNPETGKIEEIQTTRTVYRNTEWDPDLVIPAGTKIGNENATEVDTTNIERMKSGKAPVIVETNETGEVLYDKIELHHLTGEEIQKSSPYFNGETRDGTLVEIRSSKHDEYTKQIHNVNEKDVSFRTEIVENTDADGNTVRTREKTTENAHYNKVREQYWKDRAAEQQNDYVDVQTQTNTSDNITNENDYVGVSAETQSVSNETTTEQIETNSIDNSNSME